MPDMLANDSTNNWNQILGMHAIQLNIYGKEATGTKINVIKKKNQYLGDNVKEFQNTCYLVYDVPT